MSLVLTGPATATPGSTISLRLRVRAVNTPVTLQIESPDVLISQGSKVVGRYTGAEAAMGEGFTATASGVALPVATLVAGCQTRSHTDPAHPNAGRAPLPPGRYDLIGVFESIDAGHPGTYVSQPAQLTVQ